ncbi:hypothetical protein FDH86_gp097 [Arthrobacter phage Tank]|uniref:Uncharacterized protein n=1 Tax=Arthrobacter phage Tank TaxID=1772319 RepID=A0A0U4KSA1_9CAUD|nr:hypothetical protein FDH86_gp097 [Arthrobacter phage Tank]ALY10632.1 hypothetical protein TANK_97 [Arthrobacter phage Tank]
MIHEIRSTTTINRAMTVQHQPDGSELVVTIGRDGEGPLMETMGQIRVDRNDLAAALELDTGLLERMQKLADSWVFTNKQQRQELLAAMNPFEMPYEVGTVIRGRRPGEEKFRLFIYADDSWFEINHYGKRYTSVDILAEYKELEVLREGYTLDAIESFRTDSEEGGES